MASKINKRNKAMNENPICYKNDFDEIVALFRKSIEAEYQSNPEIEIDTEKLIQEFQNKLHESLQVLPNVEENQTAKNAKNKIKKMQAEAVQIKTNLRNYHTNFIDNIRAQIEQDLSSKLPHIEKFEEDEDYINNPELLYYLDLLDKNLEELPEKIDKTKAVMTGCLEKNINFEKSISSSLNNK